ncbi:hypothetical protein FA95DRAFT_1608371 [Auriscalpium vulgare]|uniref:Uncharacterized protein n=1 Tax=Auriscalpium vulgare TaxID=40419 RepID=A0ACB8RL09_9AGAM|nr:hypothetical protein FA95DRAFT_1608371 [Auriscalpium vulgare]
MGSVLQPAFLWESLTTFEPLGSLSDLGKSAFTTLAPLRQAVEFLRPTVRIQPYTGCIDLNAKHLFFYFFESRSDPDKDDFIAWTNGGPGCSSATGLFIELAAEEASKDVAAFLVIFFEHFSSFKDWVDLELQVPYDKPKKSLAMINRWLA